MEMFGWILAAFLVGFIIGAMMGAHAVEKGKS